jgi:hypothetical protein
VFFSSVAHATLITFTGWSAKIIAPSHAPDARPRAPSGMTVASTRQRSSDAVTWSRSVVRWYPAGSSPKR